MGMAAVMGRSDGLAGKEGLGKLKETCFQVFGEEEKEHVEKAKL